MAEELKIGMSNIARRMVTDQNTAAAYGTGAMAVFSTPAMISMMEEASFLLRGKREEAVVRMGP